LVSVVGAELYRPPFLVAMPWLDGATLRERLNRGQQFDLPEALWLARQTAEAIGALYQSGWLHGDVKPSNIMVAPNGHVTLLDLGFARPVEQSGSIAERWILGTCNYLAPEWFTSALAADIRSDIYSLGVILFELLTGRLPYQGRTIGELAAAHRSEAPPPLRKLAPCAPAEVARLVHAMIAKDPLRRPQTPAEVIDRLMRLEIELFTARAWA
jgi:serine/threonine-protein kinase